MSADRELLDIAETLMSSAARLSAIAKNIGELREGLDRLERELKKAAAPADRLTDRLSEEGSIHVVS